MIVGRGGRADCVIEAETVVIGGVFRGDVRARQKVVVLSSAIVFGNIYAPRLVVEEGVIVSGTFSVTGDQAATVSAGMSKELLVETVKRREMARTVAQPEPTAALVPPERQQWNG